jgi:Site-specific recombinase XerD
MAKTLTEATLTTRNARSNLAVGVHWRGIDPDVHLGYRKGKRGGVWLVRWRNGVGYRQERLGTADDEMREDTLDFNAAVKAARASVEAARIEARATADGPKLTVRYAVEAYVAERDARESKRKARPVRSDAGHRLERYVVGKEGKGKRAAIIPAPLADIVLHELSEEALLDWRASLPEALKTSSKQRLINDLKAALNGTYAAQRRRLPATFPSTIKHGLGASVLQSEEAEQVARDNQILSDAKIAEVLAAARDIDEIEGREGDLYRLIVVMAATGARFSQVIRLRVMDVQLEGNRLLMPASRKGRGAKQAMTPIPVGADVLNALRPILSHLGREEILLQRWLQQQIKGSIRWERKGRGPWQVPAEIVRSWSKIRKAARLDANVVPYALRHSSIVRGIRSGLPIRLVAALHDTSVAMIERHYGRWIADGLEDLAAKAVVQLIPQ